MTAIFSGKKTRQAYFPNSAGGSVSQAGLGSLSAKYESSGNPGTIANNKGDIGGKSYGTYQLTKASGHAQAFANSYGGALKGLTAGTAAFDRAWKAEASKNPKKFAEAQHNYIAQKHYQPALNKAVEIFGSRVKQAPKAVHDMIWSIGVQHGAGGAANVFKNAGVKSTDSWKTVVTKVYNERMKVNKYFSSSSQAIKNSVLNRFKKELQDALKMLG